MCAGCSPPFCFLRENHLQAENSAISSSGKTALRNQAGFSVSSCIEVADVVVYEWRHFRCGQKAQNAFRCRTRRSDCHGAVYNQRRRFGVFKHQFGSVNINFRLCQHVLVTDRAQCSKTWVMLSKNPQSRFVHQVSDRPRHGIQFRNRGRSAICGLIAKQLGLGDRFRTAEGMKFPLSRLFCWLHARRKENDAQ